MEAPDYYFECHLIQLFRILFFIAELGAKGIVSDCDDTWKQQIPFEVLPEKIQAIIYDDEAYSKYLLELEKSLVDSGHLAEEKLPYSEKDLFLVLAMQVYTGTCLKFGKSKWKSTMKISNQ